MTYITAQVQPEEPRTWILFYENSLGENYPLAVWHDLTADEAQAKFEAYIFEHGYPADAIQGVEAFWGQEKWYYEAEAAQ